MTTEELRKLLKIELHCHLDGSLRQKFFQARSGRKVNEGELQVSENCRSLSEYLDKFRLSLACLHDREELTAARTRKKRYTENYSIMEMRRL